MLDSRVVCELATHMPVHVVDGSDLNGVIAHASTTECVHAVAKDCDVLIAWANPNLMELLVNIAVPVVFVAHGEGSWTSRSAAANASRVAHFVAVSEAAATALARARRYHSKVIYNGVELDRCIPIIDRKQQRRTWGVPEGAFVVGYLGRFSAEKNPLAAAQAVAALGGSAIAVFVGTGAWESGLRRVAEEIAPGRCYFVGPELHVGNALSAFDVALFASHEEGFGLAMVEAWAAGTPTVCTEVGAVPELSRRFGMLTVTVPPNPSGEQLARGIRTAIAPENMATVRRAQTVAKEHLDAQRMADEWTAYLQQFARRTAE